MQQQPAILYFSQQCRECMKFCKLLQTYNPQLMRQLQYIDIDYNQFPQFIEYVPAVYLVCQNQLFQANQAFQWLKHVTLQANAVQQQQAGYSQQQVQQQQQVIEDGFNAIQPAVKNFSYVAHKRANSEGVLDEKISTSFDNQGKIHVPQTPMDGSASSGQEQFVIQPPGQGGWGQQQQQQHQQQDGWGGAMSAAGPNNNSNIPPLPAALQPIDTKLDGAAAMNEMNNKLNDLMARRDADVPIRSQRM